MPSTYTVNLGIEKPATGEQSGTWGDTTNVNFDILDQAVNGAARVTLTSAGSSGSPNALQITNGATSDGRNKWVEFYSSGDLGGSVYVQLDPNDAEKIVFVRNSLASSRSILLFQGTYNSGRDLEVPAGVDMVVKFDGGGASAATVTDVFTKLRATEITTPTLTATTADINGGTIDNSVIGGSTAAAVTGTAVVANTSLNIAGDGATVTGIKDEDNMASNSATKLATQQSIKAYVDSQVGTVDTWAEVLANGATSGSTNPEVTAGQALKTNTINETSAGSGVTIDSVLLKDDVVNATDVETSSISANDGTASATIANSTGNFTVTNFISNSVDIGGGAIDGTVIGGASAAAGSFTTIVGTSATIDDITINGSTLTSTGDFIVDAAADIIFDADANDVLFKDGGTEYFRITNNGTSFVRLDSVGDIILDADGGDIYLDDGGTGFGQISGVSSNLTIKSSTADKDIIFKGNDGGSEVTALTLDMSDGGEAYFAKNIHATSAFLTTANNDPQLTLISTDADASVGPILKLYRNSASPADGDVLGRIQWSGEDDAGNDSTFARLTVTATDVSNGAETAKMVFAPATSDAFPDALTLTGDGAAFNDDLFVGSTITGYDDITGGAGLAIGDGSDTTAGIMIRTGGTGTGRIYFGDNSGNAAGRKAGRIEYSHSAEEMTVFSTGSLILDSVTGVLDFDDNGTNIGRFENSSSNFKMESRVQDKDIVFVGNDGGVGVTALTLDMSAAGAATFNNNIKTQTLLQSIGADTQTNVTASQTIGIHLQNTSNTDGNFVPIDFYNSTGFVTGRIGAEFQDAGDRNTDLYFATRANGGGLTERFRIASNGAATFNSSVDAGAGLRFSTDGSNNGVIQTLGQDKDLYFAGDDGGAGINALILDMSDGGAATFNSSISSGALTTSGNITLDVADGGGSPAMTATLRLKGYEGRVAQV